MRGPASGSVRGPVRVQRVVQLSSVQLGVQLGVQ